MPEIQFEKDEIVEFLWEFGEIENLSQKMTALKGIDWNPFDSDDDEHEGVWGEMANNFNLVFDALSALVMTAEKMVIGGVSLNNQQKHDAVVSALDRAVRAPWYLEPFDGPALDMLVKMAVSYFNRINWGLAEGQELDKLIVEKVDNKLVSMAKSD